MYEYEFELICFVHLIDKANDKRAEISRKRSLKCMKLFSTRSTLHLPSSSTLDSSGPLPHIRLFIDSKKGVLGKKEQRLKSKTIKSDSSLAWRRERKT
jgi:hypothetical protein